MRAVSLVSGAGTSVGRLIAELLLARGDAVSVCDVDRVALDRTLSENPGMHGVCCSLAQREAVRDWVLAASAELGAVTNLVNCVGIGGPRGATEDLSDEDWRATFDVNVHGIFYAMQEVIPLMKRNRKGAIVNFSTSSTRTRLPNRSAYVATKFALEGLTLNAARELGPHGIRCNALLPGIIDNERMRRIIAERAAAEGVEPADLEKDYLRYISLRSKTSPRQLADTVLFLTSDGGAAITGECLAVSGNLEWEE